MKIHEYQAKAILKSFGVPVPDGQVATHARDALKIAERIGFPVVVKAQVHVGGRGKAGGVKLANDLAELEQAAGSILGMSIKDTKVRKILIETAANIQKEYYVGIVIDRAEKYPVMMVSAAGGVDIEEVAAKTPEKILKIHIKPQLGLMAFQVRQAMYFLELPASGAKSFSRITRALYDAFTAKDCSLAEINPLVMNEDGELMCCDAKMNFDDNALWRHHDLEAMRDEGEEEPLETAARKKRVSYVKLSGTIGCIVNGAGLAMATMDIVKQFGGEPANFLDIGGGAKAEQVTEALRIVTSDPNVKAILFNIFGGIVRCDLVAKGILDALAVLKLNLPIVIRLSGTNEEEAHAMLKDTALIPMPTMSEAAEKAVEVSRR
jgi:succinyl-CoA synthetase beta subunit